MAYAPPEAMGIFVLARDARAMVSPRAHFLAGGVCFAMEDVAMGIRSFSCAQERDSAGHACCVFRFFVKLQEDVLERRLFDQQAVDLVAAQGLDQGIHAAAHT